jgi:NTE family protein
MLPGAVTHYVANSQITRQRIQRLWERDSVVVHPPVEADRFEIGTPEDFFLMVMELVRHKRVELALEAANRAGKPIKVVGTGPDLERLQGLHGDHAEFLGRVDDAGLTLYSRALGLIVPNVEEFGIAAVEAQAAGRLVVAVNAGGARETVIDGTTGVLVPSTTWTRSPRPWPQRTSRGSPLSASASTPTASPPRCSSTASPPRWLSWRRWTCPRLRPLSGRLQNPGCRRRSPPGPRTLAYLWWALVTESPEHAQRERIGLVLAGGGARGAYEIGALSALLPHLAEGERPDIIVGTSVGAINAAYLAATAHQPLDERLENGCDIWRRINEWTRVLEPLCSIAEGKLLLRLGADAVGVPGVHAWTLLDPAPLRETLEQTIRFQEIGANVRRGTIHTAAVVTTRASTSLSVVFCVTQGAIHLADSRRGIEYQSTDELELEHVLASAAIPGAFPAVKLEIGGQPPTWYSDGGTRLNTPIKPAIKLGAERLIIVALQSPMLGVAAGELDRPEVADAAGQFLQSVLIDPLVNDLHTLTTINALVPSGGARARGRGFRRIPYILIAPELPYEVGKLAAARYEARYAGSRNLRRRCESVARIGRLLDVGDNDLRGELLSYFLFDAEFADELISLGRRDAERWLEQARRGEHEMGLWRTSAPC